jgi:hypothetical protein
MVIFVLLPCMYSYIIAIIQMLVSVNVSSYYCYKLYEQTLGCIKIIFIFFYIILYSNCIFFHKCRPITTRWSSIKLR